jgi:hypothetical protein
VTLTGSGGCRLRTIPTPLRLYSLRFQLRDRRLRVGIGLAYTRSGQAERTGAVGFSVVAGPQIVGAFRSGKIGVQAVSRTPKNA